MLIFYWQEIEIHAVQYKINEIPTPTEIRTHSYTQTKDILLLNKYNSHGRIYTRKHCCFLNTGDAHAHTRAHKMTYTQTKKKHFQSSILYENCIITHTHTHARTHTSTYTYIHTQHTYTRTHARTSEFAWIKTSPRPNSQPRKNRIFRRVLTRFFWTPSPGFRCEGLCICIPYLLFWQNAVSSRSPRLCPLRRTKKKRYWNCAGVSVMKKKMYWNL
jgi:hypothetical protein